MFRLFLRSAVVAVILAGLCAPAGAEETRGPSPVQVQRAEKIAAALGLADTAKAGRVRDLIARQYYDLSLIHATRDSQIKAAKEKAATDKSVAEAGIAAARATAEAAQDRLHPEYLARLANELTPAQIEQVKDGMTYGTVPITFQAYQQMLPDLKPEQSRQILAWLTEAREHAMDASNTEEKRAWFGKYKGKIGNYLAKAGYNMKEAEKRLTTKPEAIPPSSTEPLHP